MSAPIMPAVLTEAGLEIAACDVFVPRSQLLSGVSIAPGDVAVVSGSLVEGMGNEFSDIDVHVICRTRPRRNAFDLSQHHRILTASRSIVRADEAPNEPDVFLVHSPVAGTGIKIDVEYDTYDDIARMKARISEIYDYARRNLVLLTKGMDVREKILPHRLLSGIAIGGDPSAVFDANDNRRFRYLLYRWKASDFMMLLDCLGTFRKGEYLRAADIARENLLLQAGAFVALLGGLNTRRKWVPVYLELLGSNYTEIIAEFLACYPGPRSAEPSEARAYVLRVVDLIDAIFSASIPLLDRMGGVPVGDEALELLRLDRDRATTGTPYAEMEFEYRARAYCDLKTSTADLFVRT